MHETIGGGRRLTSVIIACIGRLEPSRHCIDSVFRHTQSPWELIAIADGTSDGVAAYLQGLQIAAPCRVVILPQSEFIDLSAALEQALAEAQGHYLALLDDHAVVTDAWLEQLIDLVETDPIIGMAGVMSNEADPPQLVEAIPYANADSMQSFALNWREEHRGLYLTVPRLSGPCLLLKREAFEAADGRSALISQAPSAEENHLGSRMIKAGYLLAVARDLFIHQDTKISESPEVGNERGTSQQQEPRRSDLDARSNGRTAKSARPKVSLTMIVRDAETELRNCLASVEGLCDEIVVVDTGSVDRTIEVARSFGARVFDFPWVDDYAAARNAALARARGDYIFWLDAQDLIDPLERPKFQSLFEELGRVPRARVIRRTRSDEPQGYAAQAIEGVHLFPNHQDIRWYFRANERILPALRRAGIEVRRCHATIRRAINGDCESWIRKLDRDRRYLEAEHADRPDDPYIAHHLGLIALDRDDPGSALAWFHQGLEHANPSYPLAKILTDLIAEVHRSLGDVNGDLEIGGPAPAIGRIS